MPNFSIDITEGMGPSEIKVRPNSMNLTSDPLTGYVKIRTSDGFSQSIPLTQKTGKFTYKYTLEANPATIQIDSFGGSATLNITSIKETYLDDVLLETDENWGYSLSADPGITLDGNTVTVGENVNNYDITSKVKVTQNESGKTIEITIQQLAGEVVGEYEFSASPTSLSFVALGQSKNINVTSMFHYTFNGEWRDDNVPWQVQSITAPFKISGNTVSIGENVNPSVRRGSLVLIQPASRKTITISLSQAAAEITYQYNFSVSPTSLDFAATGETKSVSITSTRDRYVNGKYSSTDNWDYSRSNGNNVSGSGTSITMGENTGDSDRSGSVTFTQNTSGKRVTVNCNQEAASIEVTYTFTISPDSLTFENTGGTQNFTVTSTKTTVVNGNSSTTNLDYSISGSVSGFTINKGSGSVTASENSGEAGRSGSFTFTQNESNKTITLNVSQGAASVETTYEFSVTPTTMEFEATGGTQAFTITSTKTVTTNGVPVTTSVGYTSSSDTSGISVSGNNVNVTEIEGDGRTGVITFTQNESGKTCTITIVQGEASIEYIFLIGLSDSSLSESVNLSYTADSKASETYNVTIRSKKVINSEETNIWYDTESDSSWIVVTKTGGGSTGSGFSWTIQENTSSSSRSGKIILTQKESGKKVYINISQEAKSAVEGWKYYLFSASNGNAINRPTITIEDPIPAEGGNVDLGDWIFAFGIKTVDGVLVIGSDDLDLNGWGNLITDSSNYDKVVRLEQSNLYLSGITRLTLTGIVRNDDRSTLQYYSLTPTFTATENDSSSDRSITLTISLDVYRDARLTYKLTQPNYEAILTFVDGSTIYADTVVFNGLPADNRVIASPKTIPVIVQDINGDTEMKVVLTTAGGTVSAGMADTPDGWKLAETSIYSDTSGNLPNQISNISIQVTREACFPLYDGKFRVSSIRALYSPDFGNPSSELLEKRLAINCQVSGYKLWYRLRIPEYIANLGASEGYYLNRGVLSYGVHCNTQEEKQSWIGDRKPFVPYFGVKTQLDDQSYLTPLPDGHQPGVAFNISGGYCYDEVIPIFMYTYNQIETISSQSNRYLSITYYNPEGSPQYKSIRVSNLIITPNQGQLWTNSGEMNSNNFGSESNPKFTIEVGNGVVWE